MQLRDLQYVIAAAEAGSFSKAALVVHVSQPASVSYTPLDVYKRQALAAVLCGAGLHAAASAMPDTQYTFHTDVYGPGVANLSSSDSYSRYQWGLKNDAELQLSLIHI